MRSRCGKCKLLIGAPTPAHPSQCSCDPAAALYEATMRRIRSRDLRRAVRRIAGPFDARPLWVRALEAAGRSYREPEAA